MIAKGLVIGSILINNEYAIKVVICIVAPAFLANDCFQIYFGWKDKKLGIVSILGHILIDIIFIPFIGCVFTLFTASNLTESKLIVYKGSFGYVTDYLQAFFYLKLIFGGIEVYYTYKDAYS